MRDGLIFWAEWSEAGLTFWIDDRSCIWALDENGIYHLYCGQYAWHTTEAAAAIAAARMFR